MIIYYGQIYVGYNSSYCTDITIKHT